MELIGIELWMPMEWRNGTAPKGGNNSWIVDGQRNAQRKKSKEWKWVWFVERATGLRPTSFNKQHSFLFISFPFHKEMNVLVELMKGIRMYYNSIKRQWSKKQKHEFMIGFALRNWCCPSPFNSHFFSQLALPNGRAGERNERVDGHWGPFRIENEQIMNGMIDLWMNNEEKQKREQHSIKIFDFYCGAANNTTHSTINTNHNQTINSIKDIWLIEFDLWIGLLIELIGLLLPAHTSIQR